MYNPIQFHLPGGLESQEPSLMTLSAGSEIWLELICLCSAFEGRKQSIRASIKNASVPLRAQELGTFLPMDGGKGSTAERFLSSLCFCQQQNNSSTIALEPFLVLSGMLQLPEKSLHSHAFTKKKPIWNWRKGGWTDSAVLWGQSTLGQHAQHQQCAITARADYKSKTPKMKEYCEAVKLESQQEDAWARRKEMRDSAKTECWINPAFALSALVAG